MPDTQMPQLGETVTEGTITRWFKQVGDQVAEDEPLFEVSTDKVDSEVPAAKAGYLKEILVEARAGCGGAEDLRPQAPGRRGRSHPVLQHPQADGRAHGALAGHLGPRADR